MMRLHVVKGLYVGRELIAMWSGMGSPSNSLKSLHHMSALGQEQSFGPGLLNVRFAPIAVIQAANREPTSPCVRLEFLGWRIWR